MKTHDELMKLTKSQLEEYGRTLGVELDRRKKKEFLVTLLVNIQELCKPGPVITANTVFNAEGPIDEAIDDVVEEVSSWYTSFIKWIKKLFK
jgi:DNA modification methylase